MSFLKRFDTALDKLLEPKVNPIKVLETKVFDKLASDGQLLEQRFTNIKAAIEEAVQQHTLTLSNLISRIENLETVLGNNVREQASRIESLTSKVEKIEVYSGMTRRVDGTSKPKAFTEM